MSKIKVEPNFDTHNPVIDDNINRVADNLDDIYADDNNEVTDDNIDDLSNEILVGDPLISNNSNTVDSSKIMKNEEFETFGNSMNVNSRLGHKKVVKYVKRLSMDKFEMLKSREKRKLAVDISEAVYKCSSCIEVFKTQLEYEEHNDVLHKKVSLVSDDFFLVLSCYVGQFDDYILVVCMDQ